ncbi:nucleotide cyclase [Baffinella frigidus]|nr:nucleotide cyclase [Cryptophyta sp. CCMP2293]
MLDELYTVFDTISSAFDVYKVGTIGDAYMIAGGIVGDKEAHATATADMAFAMRAAVKLVRAPHNGETLCIRIGIHSETRAIP